MIDSPSRQILAEPTDLLASNAAVWKREPTIVAELPAEARPIFARWYAELALVNDAIGKGREAAYCREMVAKFSVGGQPS